MRPLAHLLVYALDRKLSGTLELTGTDSARAFVVLDQGSVRKVKLTDPPLHLASILYEQGTLSIDQMSASLLDVATHKRLHGEVLLQRGFLTRAQLSDALAEQNRRKLAMIFAWDGSSTFAFYQDADTASDFGGNDWPKLDPRPAIWRGIYQYPQFTQLGSALEKAKAGRFRLSASADLEAFRFSADERRVAEAFRNRVTSLDEVKQLGYAAPHVVESIYYCLLIHKQLEAIAIPVSRTSRIPPPSNPGHPSFRMNAPAMPTQPSLGNMPRSAMPTLPIMQAVLPEDARPVHMSTATASPLARNNPSSASMPAARPSSAAGRNSVPSMPATRSSVPSMPAAAASSPSIPIMRSSVPSMPAGSPSSERRMESATGPRSSSQPGFQAVRTSGLMPKVGGTEMSEEEAGRRFLEAEACLRRGDRDRAEVYCRLVHEAFPEDQEYLALLTWLEALREENQTAKGTLACIARLDRVIAKKDESERAHYFRGLLYKRMGNSVRAAMDFKRVVDINPHHAQAKGELRLFLARRKRG